MENWIKKLSGAALAALLTLALSGKASAEDAASGDTLPDEPPKIEQAADEVENDGDGADKKAAASAGGQTVQQQSRSLSESGQKDGDEEGDGEGDGQEGDEQPAEPALLIAGEAVDLTNGGRGTGWTYDAADGSLLLVNCPEQSVATTASDVTIKAAGLNRLSSLSVDGNIHLIGTGILLVDEIELAEGKSFELMPNEAIYGENGGSVAVFLKQDDGSYLLINGGVAGILDENYTLPDGVTLVVPDGGTLQMQSLAIVRHFDDDGEPDGLYYSLSSETAALRQIPGSYDTEESGVLVPGRADIESTAAQLTIPENSKLVLEEMARIVMNSISRKVGGGTLVPKLTVAGELELDGTVTGGRTEIAVSGDVTGTGGFCDAEVTVDGGRTEAVERLSLTGGCSVRLDNAHADVDELELSGSNKLVYQGSSSIGSCEAKRGSDITCYATSGYGYSEELSFLDGISGGGSIILNSGAYVLEENCRIADGTVFTNVTTNSQGETNWNSAALYDYYRDDDFQTNLTDSVTPRVEANELGFAIGGNTYTGILTYVTRIGEGRDLDGSVMSGIKEAIPDLIASYVYKTSEGDRIYLDYATLTAYWRSCSEDESRDLGYYCDKYPDDDPEIWLETEVNGRWGYVSLSAEHPEVKVPASQILRIRLVEARRVVLGTGGGSSTHTNTNFTGSGVLGANAGSVTGGNGTSIFSGTGLSSSQSGDDNGNGNGNGNENGNGNGTDNGNGNGNGNGTGGDNGNGNENGSGNGNGTGDDNGNGNGNGNGTGNGSGTGGDPAGDNNGSGSNDAGDPADDPDPAEETVDTDGAGTQLRVWTETTNNEALFVLHLGEGDAERGTAGARITVRMAYAPAPAAAGRKLYVVFRAPDGSLRAFAADYDADSGLLIFETELLGKFVVVPLDFDGTEFSEGFYEALAGAEELRWLP